MSPAKFPSRHLGRDGPEVSAIGFGLMGLGGVSYGPAEYVDPSVPDMDDFSLSYLHVYDGGLADPP